MVSFLKNVMLHDKYHRVRADAIRTLVFAVSSIKDINQENADLFSEYLFPTLVRISRFFIAFLFNSLHDLVNTNGSR
jgi:hypothetical protein